MNHNELAHLHNDDERELEAAEYQEQQQQAAEESANAHRRHLEEDVQELTGSELKRFAARAIADVSFLESLPSGDDDNDFDLREMTKRRDSLLAEIGRRLYK